MAFVYRTLVVSSSGPQIPSNKFRRSGDEKQLNHSFNLALENWRVQRGHALQSSSSGFPIFPNTSFALGHFPCSSIFSNPTLFSTSIHSTSSIMDIVCIEHRVKIEEFKWILRQIGEHDPVESLNMIDASQRLCIDYHFREEIEAILEKHYLTFSDGANDLHETALAFRLLRQQGYSVSADRAFSNFIDEEGNFQKELSQDIEGVRSLYEAAEMSIKGEDILEEAKIFSFKVLNEWALQSDADKLMVGYTLANPHHKSLAKFMVKDYFEDYHSQNVWINALKEVAKVDFNLVQSINQNELAQVTKWWGHMGLAEELKFARDQPLKWYTCAFTCFADPTLTEERLELSKIISFIYLVDDLYDVYGTLFDLTNFTDVVIRWDVAEAKKLPKCMRICFEALYQLTHEISEKIYRKHGWNPIKSLKSSWASLCQAFLVEAEWFAAGSVPNAEEYLKNGIISTGVHTVLVHCFFLSGQGLSSQSIQLLDSFPPITTSVATILRLWDDLGSAQDENQDGHDGSYMKCFMKDHAQISEEDTRDHMLNMISEAWKKLNQEFISPTPFPAPFNAAALNMARMVPLLYAYDENQRLPTLEKYIKSALFETACIGLESL